MPNRDGTGPLGKGPMTGRELGPCGCKSRRRFKGRFIELDDQSENKSNAESEKSNEKESN